MKSSKSWIIISGILGFLGVAIGAFGAHTLKDNFSFEQMETFRTGSFYHLIHAVVITAISLTNYKRFRKSNVFFLAGIILFSFSLYLYSIFQVRIFAMITPFGGISFLFGWLFLIIDAVKKEKKDSTLLP
jgi:uncharacterized membrane protein YgdD (TMEM256/DUF423 family)